MWVVALAVVWLILAAWVIGCVLAAGWPDERPVPAPDPYANDVATFRAELADWDRRGRPQA
jgi:hypothetical protein